jgi:hypothetical protein
MQTKIRLSDCLWVRSPNSEQPLFHPITRALRQKNCRTFSLQLKTDPESLSKLKRLVWKTDDHVILHGLFPSELRKIYPVFKDRKNFSVLLVDWWTSPYWFTKNAEYLIFNIYSGIALRQHPGNFCTDDWQPPLLSKPERWIRFHIMGALLRPAALVARPFLDFRDQHRRAADVIRPDRMIYFPIPISAEDLPWVDEKPVYDFCNMGDAFGFWLMRDPYAPAKYNFASLYTDRRQLVNLIVRFENQPYRFFERTRLPERLSWERYCQIARQSRLAVCSGGMHQASVPKYLEFACLGTPMIGSVLPYEHPWLDQCLFPINALGSTPDKLKVKLDEALEAQPVLRQNCLQMRDTLLRLYDPVRVFEMAQDQIDGKPIPPGYLRDTRIISQAPLTG